MKISFHNNYKNICIIILFVFFFDFWLILVRAAAAEILPYLLECIKPKGAFTNHCLLDHNINSGPEAISEMWSYMSEKLLEAIPLEIDSEITGIMINSLSKARHRI